MQRTVRIRMTDLHRIFDSTLLTARRNRAAGEAGAHDFLLERVAVDLAERLAIVRREFPVALDAGSHHGLLGRRIAELPNVGQVISFDPALRLLEASPAPRVLGSFEALPFAQGSLDLCVSGLSLHLVDDLPGIADPDPSAS